MIVSNKSSVFYNISTITTTFISLERCLCVSWPLKFKGFMTFNRAIGVLIMIYLYCAVVSVPDYLTLSLIHLFDPRKNSTRIVLWLSPLSHHVELFNLSFHLLTSEFLCLVIILISTYIMVADLHKSLNRWAKQTIVQERYSAMKLSPGDVRKDWRESKNSRSKKRMAKTVITLAVVCSVCNSLRLLLVIINLTYVDMYTTQKNLYIDLLAVMYLLQTTNASVDIFVYFLHNSVFRSCFCEIFCRVS